MRVVFVSMNAFHDEFVRSNGATSKVLCLRAQVYAEAL